MKAFILEQGNKLLKQVESQNKDGKPFSPKEILASSQVIDKLLSMQDEFLKIVRDCFSNDTHFSIVRQQGFESFINFEIGEFTVAEILATYCDNILRKNGLKVP